MTIQKRRLYFLKLGLGERLRAVIVVSGTKVAQELKLSRSPEQGVILAKVRECLLDTIVKMCCMLDSRLQCKNMFSQDCKIFRFSPYYDSARQHYLKFRIAI